MLDLNLPAVSIEDEMHIKLLGEKSGTVACNSLHFLDPLLTAFALIRSLSETNVTWMRASELYLPAKGRHWQTSLASDSLRPVPRTTQKLTRYVNLLASVAVRKSLETLAEQFCYLVT